MNDRRIKKGQRLSPTTSDRRRYPQLPVPLVLCLAAVVAAVMFAFLLRLL